MTQSIPLSGVSPARRAVALRSVVAGVVVRSCVPCVGAAFAWGDLTCVVADECGAFVVGFLFKNLNDILFIRHFASERCRRNIGAAVPRFGVPVAPEVLEHGGIGRE